MRTLKIISILFLLTISSTAVYAQSNTYASELWPEVRWSETLSSKWGTRLDVRWITQSPSNKLLGHQYDKQLMIRPWVFYKLPAKFQVGLSPFGYWKTMTNKESGKVGYSEYRVSGEITHDLSVGVGKIGNRIRIEDRYFSKAGENVHQAMRYRYQLKYTLPTKKQDGKTKQYFTVNDELFLNGGSDFTGHKLFDQNRLYVAYGWFFTPKMNLEMGYLGRAKVNHWDQSIRIRLNMRGLLTAKN